jgi:maltose O-acetyltransferase
MLFVQWLERSLAMSSKTELEKMLAGERYNCLDPELDAIRQEAKALMRRYNQTETESQRQALLPLMFGGIGKNLVIEPPFYCSYGKNTYFGDYAFLNYMCDIIDNNEVRIGSHVMFGPSVHIFTAAHDLQAEARIRGWEIAKPVTIEDNVWLGGGALILPGVRIGKNAVVGAGAVVTKDVPANTIVGGNPAKVIREIEPG